MKKYLYILFFFGFTFGWSGNFLPTENVSGEISMHTFDEKERVVLTPNPATTYTHIKVTADDSKIAEVTIYSLLGNKLFMEKYSGNEKSIQLNVQNFKRGKYLVKVTFSDGTSEVKALIKQ